MGEITATGVWLKESLDGSYKWSSPKKGKLLVNEESIEFDDIKISTNELDNVTLNSEKIMFKLTKQLIFSRGDEKYLFTFDEHVDESKIIPFQFESTEKKSFIGKLVIVSMVLLLINFGFDVLL